MKVKFGKTALKILLPLMFMAASALLIAVMILFGKSPDTKERAKVLPRVEVLRVESQPISLSVNSQGTVQARTRTLLTAEVSGVVEYVSPKLFPGNFFDEGDILLKIDPTQYEAALANARGQLANARLAYAQEKALGEQARLDWEEMGKGPAGDLVLRIPQLEKAAADLESARAAIKLAERNLSKTSLRAPYAGSVYEKLVDIGQTVSARMTELARIFSVDLVEVRLPVSAKEAGYLTLPETYRNGLVAEAKPKVVLSSRLGKRDWTWEGFIDRTEGVIDPSTRQIFLVAMVEDPYGRIMERDRPPLKIGQFVEAAISGRHLGKGFIIPRAALKPGDIVYVISPENRLIITPVTVAQAGVEKVYTTEGLEDGDRICLTPLSIVVNGMEVMVERELEGEEGNSSI